MKSLTLIPSIIVLLLTGCGQKVDNRVPGSDFAISDMVQPVPVENVQIDSAWNIWCGSAVQGDDDKYYLYYSRWPKSSGHESWVSHSEIAYAVADKAEGPYEHSGVVLGYNDSISWDGCMKHNPYIIKNNGRYYLYYIGTKGKQLAADEWEIPYGSEWWKRRNTQRIGVAVAESPKGPWQTFDTPVFSNNPDSTAFDALLVSNPAVCVGRNCQIVMLYKAVCNNGTISGGKVRFSVAFADAPTGPFIRSGKQIFLPADPEASMVAEDPFIWYDSHTDRYYAIVRDVVRQFTGADSGGLALMESVDAIDWQPARFSKVIPAEIPWENGDAYDANDLSFERPFLLFDKNGMPEVLFGACGVTENGVKRAHSFNMRIPLKAPEHSEAL